MFIIHKDPDTTLSLGFDWQEELDGLSISTSTWFVPAGITKESESSNATTASIRLSGGTANEIYDLVNLITRSDGDTRTRTLRIVCVNK